MEKDVAIIGAGLAGLRCAGLLERAGLDVALLEASDAPGGRIRTDIVDGFRLDRGFQIMLTAYPDARSALHYRSLKLRRFIPGAMVWHGGRFHRFADPWREPVAAARFLFDDVVSLADKLRVAALRARVRSGEPEDLFTRPDMAHLRLPAKFGFSPRMIERFFSPFFGGIFLEQELVTSSRYFQYLFRIFAAGSVAVPQDGMEKIPQQLAAHLKPARFRPAFASLAWPAVPSGSRSLSRTAALSDLLGPMGLLGPLGQSGLSGLSDLSDLSDPSKPSTSSIAVAEHEQRPLLTEVLTPKRAQAREARDWNSTTTLYYSSIKSPVEGAILVLNGEGPGAGPINNLAVMTQASRHYAPPGQELISVSCVGIGPNNDEEMRALDAAVREQATQWFGPQVDEWQLLAGYPIRHALPLARTTQWQASSPRLADNVYICSDAQEQPSQQGALASGRRAAEAILAQRGALVSGS